MWVLRFIRWKNLLIIALTQSLIAVYGPYSYGFDLVLRSLVLLITASVCIAAGGNIINDIYDEKIDEVNRPDRRVVGVHTSARISSIAAGILFCVGIVCGFTIRMELGCINIGVSVLLWLYSYRLKCTPLLGNLAVAICMGMTVWVVCFIAPVRYEVLMLYAFFAAAAGLVREMVKDIEDHAGDAAQGCKTLPVSIGTYSAKALASIIQFVLAILIGFGCVLLLNDQPHFDTYYLVIAVQLPMLGIGFWIAFGRQKKDFHRISAALKIIMLLGLLYLPLSFYLH